MKIYLSGPISSPVPGLEKAELKGRFYAVEDFLKKNFTTWEPVNPLEVSACEDRSCVTPDSDLDHSWACWLKYDLIAMLDCEAILMLPAWGQSAGASLEKYVAERVHMGVYYAQLDDEEGWLIT